MSQTTRIRWASCPTDLSKVGTEETVAADLATELVMFGNAVIVGSQQDKDIAAARASNLDHPAVKAPTVKSTPAVTASE